MHAIFNADDPVTAHLSRDLATGVCCLYYSQQSDKSDLYCRNVQLLPGGGIRATVVSPWGRGELHSSLSGRFTLSNLLAVIAVLGSHGFSLTQILAAITTLQPPPGRLVGYGGGQHPAVFVDYAHTPAALEAVLTALQEHGEGKAITCVVGCGGDRDRDKRALMGKVACQKAERVVLTADNPRSESVRAIIDDMMAGIVEAERHKVQVIENRATAIQWAIEQSAAGELVLVAGKGHECYQEVAGKKLPFSDQKHVLRALSGGHA